MPHLSVEQVAALTALISAAGLDASLWPQVMDKLAAISGGARPHLLGHDLRTRRVLSEEAALFDPEYVRMYMDYYGAINPKAPLIGALPVGQVRRTLEVLSQEELFKTQYYWEYLRPQEDIYGGGGGVLFRDADRFVFLGAYIRGKDRDKIEDPWIKLLQLVFPHFQHALEMNRLLDGHRLQGLIDRETQSSGTVAIIVLSTGGRLLYANAPAAGLIAAGDPLQETTLGRIRLVGSGGRELAESIDALNGIAAVAERAFLVRSAKAKGWQARTMAFDPRRLGFSPFGMAYGFNDRCLLLVLRELRQDDEAGGQVAALLGLTKAEAKVALALAAGQSLNAIADSQARSIHTIRNQLKSAMLKAGVRRQTDLVGLVERIRNAR